MQEIQSVQNPVVKRLKSLKDRKARLEYDELLIEGEKLIAEALDLGYAVHDVLVCDSMTDKFSGLLNRLAQTKAGLYAVPQRVLEAVCDTKTPQGICAAFRLPVSMEKEKLPDRLVVLDGVQDPGNVGTIWRTADAAGIQAVVMTDKCADPFSPKVQRSAMGSGLRLGVHITDALPRLLTELREKGYTVIASSLHGEPFYEAELDREKFALIIGNEARGVSEECMNAANLRLKLPMRGGAESLNASVAAGIMMYELMKNKM